MSASLVGSEMCIRDRSREAPSAGAGGDARWPSQRGGRRPRAWEFGQQGDCLLYTSDAADDM
eukprot:12911096-Alexandrium_andersonii.AAC.1